MGKLITILLLVILVAAGTFYFLNEGGAVSLDKPLPKVAALDVKCVESGGSWLAAVNQCEWQSLEEDQNPASACATMGGKFEECESPCRNVSESETCIGVCVPVCSFK